jgi:hypothetical protein
LQRRSIPHAVRRVVGSGPPQGGWLACGIEALPQYEQRDLGRGERNDVANFAHLDPAKGLQVDVAFDEPEHHSPEEDRNRNPSFMR